MEREFEHRLTEVEDRSKSNTKRLDKVEERQDNLEELVGSVKVLAVEVGNMKTDVAETKKNVKALSEKPAQRWENLVSQLVSLIVAAAFGFLLAKFGLG